jgi:putative RNA 2'-phosphotransferase
MDRSKKISKRLSYVLRHRPEKFNIILDKEGWANVQDILNNCQEGMGLESPFNIDELREIVTTNDKQRFKFNDDMTKIKANQGHSINVDLNLKPLKRFELPDVLYHGTAERFMDSIMKTGLNRMNRHHVHMYSFKDMEKAGNTGARHQRGTKPVILAIDAGEMYQDGYIFYKTDNNVYLTESVPKKYIIKI